MTRSQHKVVSLEKSACLVHSALPALSGFKRPHKGQAARGGVLLPLEMRANEHSRHKRLVHALHDTLCLSRTLTAERSPLALNFRVISCGYSVGRTRIECSCTDKKMQPPCIFFTVSGNASFDFAHLACIELDPFAH